MSEALKESYFRYLDDLRMSGVRNMFVLKFYLRKEFAFDEHESQKILDDWLKSKEGKKNEI